MISKSIRPGPGLILTLFAAAVLVPSANYLIFSGLPMDSPLEFTALILLMPLILSRRLRRLFSIALLGLGHTFRMVLLACILLVLIAKLILMASGTYEGYLACYRSTLSDPPAGRCEKSYENPFAHFEVTRIDRNIRFDEREWNLSFFNSHRFNFYAWEEGRVSRTRIPFEVDWLGNLRQRSEDTEVRISYVGEGVVSLADGETITLEPSYRVPRVVRIHLPAETDALAITYRFDDGYRVGQSDKLGPYALFSLGIASLASSGIEGGLLLPATPPAIWLVLGYGIDLVILSAGAGIVAFYISVLWKDWWILAITGALGLAAMNLPEIALLPKTRAIVPLFWLLFSSLMFTRHRTRLFSCYLALAYLAVLRVSLFEPDLAMVQIRGGGSDFLTYESFARSILETGSLRAGEGIFYYQPLFRYTTFAEHFLLGDGDGFVAALALLGSTFGVFYLYDRLDIGRRGGRKIIYLAGLAGLLLLTLLTSWDLVYFLHIGASEFPTWILLPYVVVFLFVSSDPRAWSLGVLLTGASVLIRPNHALPAIALMLVFITSIFRTRRRLALAFAALLVALAVLPALHNLIYGGELVFVPRSASVKENLVLPPATLLREFGEPGVRAEALRQAERLFYFGELAVQASALGLALHGLQLIYLVSWVWVARNWRRVGLIVKMLLLIPLMHLGAQFFFVLDAVYPRHILTAHLSRGVAVIYVFSAYAELGWNDSVRTHQLAESNVSA